MEPDNIKILLDISERLARVEGKLDAYNNLTKKIDRLDERIGKLECAPGGRWQTLTNAIIGAIGTIIGGAIIGVIALNIKP